MVKRLSLVINTQKDSSSRPDSIKKRLWQRMSAWEKLKSCIFYSIQKIDMKLVLEAFIARCCGGTVITSAEHAEVLEFKPGQHQGKFLTKWCFFTWLKLKSSILFLINPTFDMKLLLRSTNHKVLWWSGYHVWLTRRRSAVQN